MPTRNPNDWRVVKRLKQHDRMVADALQARQLFRDRFGIRTSPLYPKIAPDDADGRGPRLVALVTDLVDLSTQTLVDRRGDEEESFTLCHCCDEVDSHTTDCPIAALDGWLRKEE